LPKAEAEEHDDTALAKKVKLVDASGNPIDEDNPLPVASYPKIVYASGNLSGGVIEHISDETNWNTNAAIIKHIKIDTDSTDWNLTIYCDSDGSSGMFGSIDLVKNAKGNLDLSLDLPYKDNDNAKQVHLKFDDNAGNNTASCLIMGIKAN